MYTVVFEKAIITYTFLVDMEAPEISSPIQEMKQDFEDFQNGKLPKEKMSDAEQDVLLAEPGALNWFRAPFDDPQFLAEAALEKRFMKIVQTERPQGQGVSVALNVHNAGNPSTEPANVSAVRQQIARGERAGRLVTIGVEIMHSEIDQADTGPNVLPFCGFSWLTNQIEDEPGGGLALLHMTARQIPA